MAEDCVDLLLPEIAVFLFHLIDQRSTVAVLHENVDVVG